MALPLNILERSMGKKLAILLKDGRKLKGDLKGYDEYMNLVLENTVEEREEGTRTLGDVILRGNNVVSISPDNP